MHFKNRITLFLYFRASHYFFICNRGHLRVFNKLVLSSTKTSLAFIETAFKTLRQQANLSYTSFSHFLQSMLSPLQILAGAYQYFSSHSAGQESEISHGHCREFQS